jgi:hypothetical protein
MAVSGAPSGRNAFSSYNPVVLAHFVRFTTGYLLTTLWVEMQLPPTALTFPNMLYSLHSNGQGCARVMPNSRR